MTKDFKQIADDVMNGVGLIRQGAPETMKAFGALSGAATAPHALDMKTKELMALAIGIAVHCDGCVAYHTKMAHKHGATREEVAERSPWRSTWVAGPRSMARMRCVPTMSSTVPWRPVRCTALNCTKGT